MTNVPAEATAVDRVSLWPFVGCILSLYIISYLMDQFMDDGPGPAMVYGAFALMPLAFISIIWLISVGVAFYHRRMIMGVSRLLGPPLAIAISIGLSSVGAPPWRVIFEFMRPYYIYRVLSAPTGAAYKHVSFPQFDMELWSGHASRTYFYDGSPMPIISRSECVDETRTTTTSLGFGFYAQNTYTSYGTPCPW